MIRAISLAVLFSCAPALAAAATPPPATATPAPPTAAPEATPPSDAVVTGWARQWLRYMQLGNIADRSQLDSSMDAFLTQDTVLRIQGQMNSLGQPIAFTLVRKFPTNGFMEYDFRMRFDNGTWIEALTLDPNNQIAGLRFYPGQ